MFCLHCGSFNFYFQMFQCTNDGIQLAEFNRFSYFNQTLGFYDKQVLKKDLYTSE